MGLNLQLQALTFPSGTEFPGTIQALQNLQAQYFAINGGANFNGVNYGSTTPAPADRDKGWYKTDGSGAFLGWYYWTGSTWDRMQVIPQSGNYSAAPTAIAQGQLYYATDIQRLCVWNNSNWVTADGASGEVRFVRGTNITTILTHYPGWTQVTDMAGAGLAVAGDGTINGWSARTAETHVGEEKHTQTIDELVNHGHNVDAAGTVGAGGAQAGSNSAIKQTTTIATTSVGNGSAFNVMQPTWFLFCIQKT